MLKSALPEDDYLTLVDDDEPAETSSDRPDPVWRVLIVDDDDDLHETTRFALRAARVLDRNLELVHAYSARECFARIDEFQDVAVALIDVVMETPDAGLRLVEGLRARGLTDMRIVLRTGQPGYAPEMSVISEYEIDDYRTKAELTQTRLITVLTSSIRAYNQIRTINHSRAGLRMIVDSSKELFKRSNLELFSWGVLTQISGLLRVTPKGIVCVDGAASEARGPRIVSAAGSFEPMLGRPAVEITQREVLDVLDAARESQDLVRRNGFIALRISGRAGQHLIALIEMRGEFEPDDLALLKLFATNISIGFENLSLVERLNKLAYIDPDLNIPNLNGFEAILASTSFDGKRLALVSIDAYPAIVADYGLANAHRYLAAVHAALTAARDDVAVARVGDGAFALLADSDLLTPSFVRSAFEQVYDIDGVEIGARATGAILDLDGPRQYAAALMRIASAALLHVQQTNRGDCVVYDSEMKRAVHRRNCLQSALKTAIEEQEGLEVYLQPKIDLVTDKVIGAEALLRWRWDGESISPAEFIPIAETTGLTLGLTDFVVRAVGAWSKSAPRPTPVAINISVADLNHPDFAARLIEEAIAAGLNPASVEFEVTEGVSMQDMPWALKQVHALKEAGFRIALDDFGTGYSSLGQFHRLPIDVLKIDRSFVSSLDVRTARHSLAAIVIGMAETLNVDCVAEGIETEEQRQALNFLGCAVGQGFLFARPMALDAFDRFMAEQA